MLSKQKKEILITFGLLAITSFLAAKPSYASPGQWWVKFEQPGVADVTDVVGFPEDMSSDDKAVYSYVPLTTSDSQFGLGIDGGAFPDPVGSGGTAEMSIADGDIATCQASPTVNHPVDGALKFKWLDSSGNAASDSPPSSSVSFTVYSYVTAAFVLNYNNPGTNYLTHEALTSYPNYLSAIGSSSYDSYTYLDNGFGDTPTSSTAFSQGVNVICEGSHAETATVTNGEATFPVKPELHLWFENNTPTTPGTRYDIVMAGAVTVHS